MSRMRIMEEEGWGVCVWEYVFVRDTQPEERCGNGKGGGAATCAPSSPSSLSLSLSLSRLDDMQDVRRQTCVLLLCAPRRGRTGLAHFCILLCCNVDCIHNFVYSSFFFFVVLKFFFSSCCVFFFLRAFCCLFYFTVFYIYFAIIILFYFLQLHYTSGHNAKPMCVTRGQGGEGLLV